MSVGVIIVANMWGVNTTFESDVGDGNLDVGPGKEVGEGDSDWSAAVVVEDDTAVEVVADRCPVRRSCVLLAEDNRVKPGRLHLVRTTMHSRPTIRAAHPLRFHKFTSILSQKTSFGTSRHLIGRLYGCHQCSSTESDGT
jgi:hypothetical protein